MTNPPLNFTDEPTRQKWIIDNAEYFTAIMPRHRFRIRVEKPTLAEAEQAAMDIIRQDVSARVLLYAVCWPHETYVKTVGAENLPQYAPQKGPLRP